MYTGGRQSQEGNRTLGYVAVVVPADANTDRAIQHIRSPRMMSPRDAVEIPHARLESRRVAYVPIPSSVWRPRVFFNRRCEKRHSRLTQSFISKAVQLPRNLICIFNLRISEFRVQRCDAYSAGQQNALLRNAFASRVRRDH